MSRQGKQSDPQQYNPSIIKLKSWVDKEVRVRFSGGRQIIGSLKSFDNSNNLIIDETVEFLRDKDDPYKITDKKRELGLIFVKGNMVLTIGLAQGMEEIENPFQASAEEQ